MNRLLNEALIGPLGDMVADCESLRERVAAAREKYPDVKGLEQAENYLRKTGVLLIGASGAATKASPGFVRRERAEDQIADRRDVETKIRLDLPREAHGGRLVVVVHGSGSGGQKRVRRLGLALDDGRIYSFYGHRPVRSQLMQLGNKWYSPQIEEELGRVSGI